ncbi:hypothetical protein IJ425_06525 [bacterium]|nr:hypothetical protein [bacterium]
MRISSISVTPQKFFKSQSNLVKKQDNTNFTAQRKDFISKKPYTAILVNPSRINIMNGDEKHLTDVGEHLRTTEDKIIADSFAIQLFMGSTSKKRTQKAFKKIMPYVTAARTKYARIQEELKGLYKTASTPADFERIKKLEKTKLQMDVKADLAMKYTDEVYYGDMMMENNTESEEESRFWFSVMH